MEFTISFNVRMMAHLLSLTMYRIHSSIYLRRAESEDGTGSRHALCGLKEMQIVTYLFCFLQNFRLSYRRFFIVLELVLGLWVPGIKKCAMQSEFRRYANLSGCDMMLRSRIHAALFNLIFLILHLNFVHHIKRFQI